MRTAVFDIECTNLRSDIGTFLIASFGELDGNGNVKKVETRDILSQHGEKNLATWTRNRFEEFDILIGHNSIAFDRNWLNGVMIRHELPFVPRRIHIDTYQVAKGKLQFQSYSLANIADVLGLGSKDEPSKNDWR